MSELGSAVPAGSLAMVRALEAEISAFRATLPRTSDKEFLARLEQLLRSEPDPELHEAIWRFKEGALDRSGLMRDPAYGRTIARRFTDAIDSLPQEQVVELHERIDEIREERRGPGEQTDGGR